MNTKLLLLLLAIASFFTNSKCAANTEDEKDLLNTLLDPKKYDARIRARGNLTSDSTIVSVNMYFRSIQKIDDVNMCYKIQLTFRMQWLDKRLEYAKTRSSLPYLTLAASSAEVWIPDLFFSNEMESHTHDLLKPNTYTRIFPDGNVLHSTRLTLTLSCPMVLKLFPMDKQTCSLRMASYGYTTEDIIFKWKKDDPVQVTPDLHLPRFALEQFTTDYCDSHTNTGVYSCLRVDLLFKREFSYYMLQIYIPSIMLIIVAYLAFWIDTKETVGRILLTLTSLVVLAIGTAAMNATLPPVSYTKAIDVWTGTCLTFILGALVTCVLGNWLSKNNKTENLGVARETDPLTTETKKSLFDNFSNSPTSRKVDVVARIVYPTFFVLFVTLYCIAYLAKNGEEGEGGLQKP